MRIALVFATVASLGACTSAKSAKSVKPHELGNDEARKVLLNRNWIERMPKTERERFHVYRFVPSMGGGVFQDRTIFKGTFELFQFETAADEIRFNLLETHDKVVSKFRIDEVDGPEPFDLELTIEADPRGPQVYYGMRAETDTDGTKLEARLRR